MATATCVGVDADAWVGKSVGSRAGVGVGSAVGAAVGSGVAVTVWSDTGVGVAVGSGVIVAVDSWVDSEGGISWDWVTAGAVASGYAVGNSETVGGRAVSVQDARASRVRSEIRESAFDILGLPLLVGVQRSILQHVDCGSPLDLWC